MKVLARHFNDSCGLFKEGKAAGRLALTAIMYVTVAATMYVTTAVAANEYYTQQLVMFTSTPTPAYSV